VVQKQAQIHMFAGKNGTSRESTQKKVGTLNEVGRALKSKKGPNDNKSSLQAPAESEQKKQSQKQGGVGGENENLRGTRRKSGIRETHPKITSDAPKQVGGTGREKHGTK